jgi:DNA-binding CsgD family transcriptional regulator
VFDGDAILIGTNVLLLRFVCTLELEALLRDLQTPRISDRPEDLPALIHLALQSEGVKRVSGLAMWHLLRGRWASNQADLRTALAAAALGAKEEGCDTIDVRHLSPGGATGPLEGLLPSLVEGTFESRVQGARLTPREAESARLTGLRGLTRKEAAAEMGIEHGTLRNYLHAALGKLGLRSELELATSLHGTIAQDRRRGRMLDSVEEAHEAHT